MTRRKVSDRERICDAVSAAYEVARAGLCLDTVREMPRLTKQHVPALQSAITAMRRDHSMPIDRIAHALNRDRKTVRYHLEAVDNPVEKLSPSLSFSPSFQLETAGA